MVNKRLEIHENHTCELHTCEETNMEVILAVMKTMLYQLYEPEFFFITARSASIFVSSTAVHIYDFHIFTVRVQSCFVKIIE